MKRTQKVSSNCYPGLLSFVGFRFISSSLESALAMLGPKKLINVHFAVGLRITWDQALFSFRFVNNIPAGRMYENRSNWAWSQVSVGRASDIFKYDGKGPSISALYCKCLKAENVILTYLNNSSRELKQRRRRRQREGKKEIGLSWQNNNLARAPA